MGALMIPTAIVVDKMPSLSWDIKGMRNKIVHDYGYVDLTIVYDTVIHGIPDMYEKLESI